MQFVIDSLSSLRMCKVIILFDPESLVKIDDSGVLGVGGVSKIEMMGDINLYTKDVKGFEHYVLLKNVSYVKDSPRNVMSITQ